MEDGASTPYLSPRALAEALGVSESSLKRWADAGTIAVARTAGGHRRIPLDEALRFIRRTHAAVVRPELLGLADLASWAARGDSTDDDATRLFHALLEDRAADARGLLLTLFLSGTPVAAIADGVLRTAMARIGELWHHDADGIVLEHRATQICLESIQGLRALLPPPRPQAPVALGGAPWNDPYILPSLLTSAVVAEAGMREHNLGPHTPAGAFERAARRYRPLLVWQSVSAEIEDARAWRTAAERLAATLAEWGGMLVVGGRESGRLPLPSNPNVHGVSTLTELAGFARGMTAGT